MTNNQILLEEIFSQNSGGICSKDSAFVERISNWAVYYKICELYSDCTLLLNSDFWPEFNFLSAPNTICLDNNSIEKNKFVKLDFNLLKEKIKNPNSNTNIFYKNNFLYSNTISKNNLKLVKYLNSDDSSFIKQIKFKNENVNIFFENNFSNVYSFQLRRGIGTLPNQKYLNDLKENKVDMKKVKLFYKKSLNINRTPNYTIELDDHYYAILDNIISLEPKRKIYLSYDVPKEFISYYLKKYPDNIVTKDDYIRNYLTYFENFDFNKKNNYNISLFQIIIDMLDFFALSHSCGIVLNQSGWTSFACAYKNKKILNI